MVKTEHYRTGRSLNSEERESMIREYLTGNYTKRESGKNTDQEIEHGQILSWMRGFGYIGGQVTAERTKKMLSLLCNPAPILTPDHPDTDPAALLKRIKESPHIWTVCLSRF